MKRGNNLPPEIVGKSLCCSTCGLKMLESWKLWQIQLHFPFWHDQEDVHLLTVGKHDTPDVPEPIDMAAAAEITKAINDLSEATVEARKATVEARQALKDLKHDLREMHGQIKEMVIEQLAEIMSELGQDARTRLRDRVDAIADEMAVAIRTKLA